MCFACNFEVISGISNELKVQKHFLDSHGVLEVV